MLKLSMYQAVRFFSHSGRCWTRASRTTSSGGSSRTAGTRKTFVAWYDWLRGVLTSRSCAIAAPPARVANVSQSSSETPPSWRRNANGKRDGAGERGDAKR